MSAKRIPGVYMIRNKINNKVYIGESVDIRTRWNKYRWAVNSKSKYPEASRMIVLTMREFGINNFEFIILASGEPYKDKDLRYSTEAQFIAKYNADDLRYGYNGCKGFEPLTYKRDDSISRIQTVREKLKRAKAIYEYDTKTDSIMLYFGGAKSWGKANGFDKDVSSHTVKRGSLILGRYYLIYASKDLRQEQLEKIRNKKCNSDGRLHRSVVRSVKAFNDYEKAVQAVERILKSRKYK